MSLEHLGLLFAWIIALAGTLIALYASEISGMAVCVLCWYQRICMFPLAIQLGIATFRKDSQIAIYSLPLVIIGALIALYHYLIQKIPSLAPYTPCKATANGVSCEQIDWQFFGFITFPLLSFVAFVILLILLLIGLNTKKTNKN